MISKKIILPAAIITIVGGSAFFGVSQIQAFTGNPLSGLAQAIASKFGLNQAQVQDVINQYRSDQKTQMIQNMQNREDERLSQLVKDGKITEQQKAAILAEEQKLKDEFKVKDLTNKSKEEIKKLMDARKTEIETWAKEQGIDLNLIHIGFFGGFGGEFRGKMGMHKGIMMR